MSGRGITAQQLKDFIIAFARVCLRKEVSDDAYKMVCKQAEACQISFVILFTKMTSSIWKN